MAVYYSPMDPARYQLYQQQRRDNQIRSLLNMIMNMQQLKQAQQQFNWKQKTWEEEYPLAVRKTKAYEAMANRPQKPSEWQVKLDFMKQLPPQMRYQAVMKWMGIPPAINYPKPLVKKAAKSLGFSYQDWVNADPKAQDNMMKQYLSSLSSGGLRPWQEYQLGKSFVNSILKNIDTTIQAYEKMGYSAEELNSMPELQNLRKARAFVAGFLRKKKLSPEDIQSLLPLLNVQNIVEMEQTPTETMPINEKKELTDEEILKQK